MQTHDPSGYFSQSTRPGQPNAPATPADADRLRAGLRLVFPPVEADDLAELAEYDTPDGLRPVVSATTERYRLARMRAWFARGGPGDDAPPLGPAAGLRVRAALGLALTLALDLDATTLADLLGVLPEELGADLYDARRSLGPPSSPACADQRAWIGRFGDRSLAPGDGVALLTHARACDACRAALQHAEAADARLLARIAEAESALPTDWRRPRPRWRGVARLATRALVGVALLAALALLARGADRLLSDEHTPVPLVAAQPAGTLSGWLVEVNQGDEYGALTAYDLASRTMRKIGAQQQLPGNWPMLSPDGTRVAYWSQTLAATTLTLAIGPLDGVATTHVQLDELDLFSTHGVWLDDATLLIVAHPNHETYLPDVADAQGATNQTELIAIDALTGRQTIIYQGNASNVVPSPDGTLVALVGDYDRGWAGQTLEVRPFDGKHLGDPIYADEHRYVGNLVWSPDSTRLYVGLIADAILTPAPSESSSGGNQPPTFERMNLAAIRRDGQTQTVIAGAPLERMAPLTVSPDGGTIVFIHAQDVSNQGRTTLLRVGRDGGQPETLLDEPAQYLASLPIWSPDGNTLLVQLYRPHYLNAGWQPDGAFADETTDQVGMMQVIAYDRAWRPHTIASEVTGPSLGEVVAWLPADALPAPPMTPAPLAGNATAPQLTPNLSHGYVTDAASGASSDGRFVVLADADAGTRVIWNVADANYRPLYGHSTDAAWLPNGQAVISVSARTSGIGSNWLAFTRPQTPRFMLSNDYLTLDPAALPADSSRRYAQPRVSPDGTLTTFFVEDAQSGVVELWLAGADREASAVARWTLPADRLLDAALAATWVDNRTLVFSQPDDWHDGLPRRVVLSRLAIDAAGVASVTPLTTRSARGGERGVVLTELALSPDGRQLAYRLRHYTKHSASGGRRDTLHVAQSSDVSRALEIARDLPGDGLAWSPDSRWLVAGLHSRVALLSADGRDLRYLTAEGASASYPIWVGPNEVWFTLDPGDGPRVWQVTVT